MATAAKKTDAPKAANRFFVMNPHGTIHEVTRDHAAELFKNPGYRKPTADQVKQYLATEIQRHDRPIGQAWTNDPGEGIDVDSLAQETPADE